MKTVIFFSILTFMFITFVVLLKVTSSKGAVQFTTTTTEKSTLCKDFQCDLSTTMLTTKAPNFFSVLFSGSQNSNKPLDKGPEYDDILKDGFNSRNAKIKNITHTKANFTHAHTKYVRELNRFNSNAGQMGQQKVSANMNDVNSEFATNNNANKNSSSSSIITNPLDSILKISDPNMRSIMTSFYGTLIGNYDCAKKTVCIMGNLFQNMPAKSLLFSVAGQFISQDWGLLYDIFRVSLLYGQNCELYVCNPGA